jgi:hypothetical protein
MGRQVLSFLPVGGSQTFHVLAIEGRRLLLP